MALLVCRYKAIMEASYTAIRNGHEVQIPVMILIAYRGVSVTCFGLDSALAYKLIQIVNT